MANTRKHMHITQICMCKIYRHAYLYMYRRAFSIQACMCT